MANIAPKSVRYIKLGERGSWLPECLADGILKFTDRVPHDVAINGDWERARQIYCEAGERTVADRIREISTFYEADAECLWITFGQGRLWWAFAAPRVELRADGARVRRTLAPWSCCDVRGRELATATLSTRLTQTAAYQRTICETSAKDYLLRRLNALPDLLALQIDALTSELHAAVEKLIVELHWRDFEMLIDLIFARGGWRRVSAVGGSSQADSDIIFEQPITGERAFVQIKSSASAATLRDYYARFAAYPNMDRFYFACHSPGGHLEVAADERAQVWLAPELAVKTVDAGLVGWILARRG